LKLLTLPIGNYQKYSEKKSKNIALKVLKHQNLAEKNNIRLEKNRQSAKKAR
jgi:hypothetical protein